MPDPGIEMIVKRRRAKELLLEVIGLSYNDASRRIMEVGLRARVLSVDGTTFAFPSDTFDPDRIGIVIASGLVTGAQVG